MVGERTELNAMEKCVSVMAKRAVKVRLRGGFSDQKRIWEVAEDEVFDPLRSGGGGISGRRRVGRRVVEIEDVLRGLVRS